MFDGTVKQEKQEQQRHYFTQKFIFTDQYDTTNVKLLIRLVVNDD